MSRSARSAGKAVVALVGMTVLAAAAVHASALDPSDASATGMGSGVAGEFGLEAAPSFDTGAGETASLAIPSPWVAGDVVQAAMAEAERVHDDSPVLGAERARILLRSLTVPGWGQATAGRRTSATIFGLSELGIWVGFTSFKVQEQMRRESYERTARLLAGIELRGRDEEFRRIIGSYLSSEQYNQLVVFRDAANLYYEDPVAYRAYIADHSLGGTDAWAWTDVDGLLRYRAQRRAADRAGLRANTALALAVINRLVSVLHAARFGPAADVSDAAPPPPRPWAIELSPAHGGNPGAFRLGVRRRF